VFAMPRHREEAGKPQSEHEQKGELNRVNEGPPEGHPLDARSRGNDTP
jgi:hypothetical protein